VSPLSIYVCVSMCLRVCMCVIDSVWVVGVTMLALGWIWFHWGRGQTESVCVCVCQARNTVGGGSSLEHVELLKINNDTYTQTHIF